MSRPPRADISSVSILLPGAGQLARVVAGKMSVVALVIRVDGAAVLLDVHGAGLPSGPARMVFNASFGGVLLAGVLIVDERGARFLPDATGQSYAQRRETFRVTVGLPATIERPGTGSIACETLNLSIGGALVQTPAPFAPPYELTLTIDCGEGQRISVAATPIRSERQATRHAVAFAKVVGADERALSALVAAAQRRALASR
jgi:PilZ domain-containing protein